MLFIVHVLFLVFSKINSDQIETNNTVSLLFPSINILHDTNRTDPNNSTIDVGTRNLNIENSNVMDKNSSQLPITMETNLSKAMDMNSSFNTTSKNSSLIELEKTPTTMDTNSLLRMDKNNMAMDANSSLRTDTKSLIGTDTKSSLIGTDTKSLIGTDAKSSLIGTDTKSLIGMDQNSSSIPMDTNASLIETDSSSINTNNSLLSNIEYRRLDSNLNLSASASPETNDSNLSFPNNSTSSPTINLSQSNSSLITNPISDTNSSKDDERRFVVNSNLSDTEKSLSSNTSLLLSTTNSSDVDTRQLNSKPIENETSNLNSNTSSQNSTSLIITDDTRKINSNSSKPIKNETSDSNSAVPSNMNSTLLIITEDSRKLNSNPKNVTSDSNVNVNSTLLIVDDTRKLNSNSSTVIDKKFDSSLNSSLPLPLAYKNISSVTMDLLTTEDDTRRIHSDSNTSVAKALDENSRKKIYLLRDENSFITEKSSLIPDENSLTADENFLTEDKEKLGLQIDGKKMSEISYGNVVLDDRKWPENTLLYIIDESITEDKKVIIRDIIKEYENRTCIIFKEVPKGTEHAVTITTNEGGCSTFCGYDRLDSNMKIKIKGCKTNVEIKMLFALRIGLIQEHRRPDRDLYINIIEKNIREGKEKNFWTLLPEEIQDLKVPYDFTSITHFTSKAFRKPGTQTIEPQKNFKDADVVLFLKKQNLSMLDSIKINKLYDCNITDEEKKFVNDLIEYIKTGNYEAYVQNLKMMFIQVQN